MRDDVENQSARRRLAATVAATPISDELGRTHRQDALNWIASGVPLWRIEKPATPNTHLVSYFVPRDPVTKRYLLVEHRLAGLLLPPGGHVEPGEDPWATVVRECGEELRYTPTGPPRRPTFLTVTETRGPNTHTDVSLWYVLDVAESAITWYDRREFTAIRWLTADDIQTMPIEQLDPHFHRFLAHLSTMAG